MKKILLAAIFFFLSGKVVLSQPAGWQYMMPIAVTENSGSTLYNYQLALTINTQALINAGQMDSNGNDIRFRSNCSGINLSYWIESGINTATTLVWVRIDTLPAGSTKVIFMFYGNASAPATSSLAVFNGPYSATDSVNITNQGGVGDSQRGFRFSPTEDILVGSFGKNEPNGTTRFITLFDVATQGIIRQLQVSGPVGIYSYSPLSSPVWLTQNTQYILELFQGPADGYYFASSSQIGQHLVYHDMRYCNSCTENTFPTQVLGNFHYGLPDFWYYTKTNITPAPTYSLGIPEQIVSVLALVTDSFVCPNTGTTLIAQISDGFAPYTYSWTPSASIINPNQDTALAFPPDTTAYQIIVTDSFGCMDLDSVTVFTYPQPTVTLSIFPDTFCLGMPPVTLTGGSPAGGTYSGPGVYSDTLYPDSAGVGTHVISYMYTDTIWGCSDSATQLISVDICTGVGNNPTEDYFSVHPNPVTNEFTIYELRFTISNIEIYNVLGKKVFEKRPTSDARRPTISVADFLPGIYFVKVRTAAGIAVKKFIKE